MSRRARKKPKSGSPPKPRRAITSVSTRERSARRANLNNLAAPNAHKDQRVPTGRCVIYEELKGAKNMLGLNNIQIIGNLGGTPDLKFLNDAKSQEVNFAVAANERSKNR